MKSFIMYWSDSIEGPYDADSVNQSIALHNRRHRGAHKIGRAEARLIHAVLQGRSSAPVRGN